ncbi:MAG: hypothetical protein KKA90_05130 [Nanoarchaeota archaeon]|nr:hypothetical protein [Nanoarchaeota archaeon]
MARRRRKTNQFSPALVLLLFAIGLFLASLSLVAMSPNADQVAGAQFFVAKVQSVPWCADNDGGMNIVQQGTCRAGTINPKTDFCLSSVDLNEFSCGSRGCINTIFDCRTEGYQECYNGACTNTTSNTHLECILNRCVVVNGTGTNQCSPQGSYCTNSTTPDLTVLSLSISGNTTVNVTAVIKNIGNATIINASTTSFILKQVPANISFSDYFTLPIPFAPGQQVTYIRGYFLPYGAQWSLVVTADAFNTVIESNEFNNQQIQNFST